MHIADEILKEVEERKIADIFSEPEKTKVFLQLKELEMIVISENGVEITEEGQKALDLGIKNYFAQKREMRSREKISEPEYTSEEEPAIDLPISYAIPAAIIILLLIMLLFGGIQMN